MRQAGADHVEITDLLWAASTDGSRLPVRQADVVGALERRGQRRAARVVSRMATVDGVLDAAEVDALGVRVHRELQRLSEELQFGRRVAATLGPMVNELRLADGAVRIVDVGCGLGYVLRWLASDDALGDNVELVGVDANAALIAEATRLSRRERLNCYFVRGDTFAPGVGVVRGPRTIVISSGLLHHLPAAELSDFFAAQQHLRVAAFAHWDIAPCRWSTVGAWVFHQARMRERVSRHDGVLSARRAHSASVLLAAARRGAETYAVRVDEGPRWQPRALDVLRPVIGTRAQ